MVVLANQADCMESARKLLHENLINGKAFEKFKVLLESQGGDTRVAEQPDSLAQATYKIELPAKKSATVAAIVAEAIGAAAGLCGAARQTKEPIIALGVQLGLH